MKDRYIIFMLDSKYKEHDGKIFSSAIEAEQYIIEALDEKYCDKAVIGFFKVDENAKEMNITMIKTFGFKADKSPRQTSLF